MYPNAAAYLETARAYPLVIKDAPVPPSPSPVQVVIETPAVAVNSLDSIIQQNGVIVPETACPFVLINNNVGKVIAIGSSVTKVEPGDRVIACAENGSFQLFNAVEQLLVASCTSKKVSYRWLDVQQL